jgi:hypothetical protein
VRSWDGETRCRLTSGKFGDFSLALDKTSATQNARAREQFFSLDMQLCPSLRLVRIDLTRYYSLTRLWVPPHIKKESKWSSHRDPCFDSE